MPPGCPRTWPCPAPWPNGTRSCARAPTRPGCWTRPPPADPAAALRAHWRATRERGYATVSGHLLHGIDSVSVPVRDAQGGLAGALTSLGLHGGFDLSRRRRARLGWRAAQRLRPTRLTGGPAADTARRPACLYNSELPQACPVRPGRPSRPISAARAARPLLPDARVTRSLTVSDFDYELPPELIAQTPAAERTGSRLLHLDDASQLHDRRFADLTGLLRSGDLLVFNDTRVIKARLNGHKTTGGKVEVLVERITEPDRALAHVRASKSPGPGMGLRLADAFDAVVLGREGELFDIRFSGPVLDLLDAHGATPLPPYITHEADAGDDARYQTVYAREPGAVAAPTAGLHFDQATLDQLDALGVERAFVTLHVGAGTFQPVRVDKLEDHIMHAEWFTVPQATVDAIAAARARGRVIAVGTTSVRALESAAAQTAGSNAPGMPLAAAQGDTRLFITPGYQYRVVDALVTNFHLPQSTLLMLVSALAGVEPIRRAYAHAVAQRYRFFSYGDAMFIESPHNNHDRTELRTARHRRRPPRPHHAEPRRGRDAHLHARGHLRQRQGHAAARAEGNRLADRAGQHLPPVAARARKSWKSMAACTASCSGTSPSSPTRAASRCSACRACARSPRKASSSPRRSMAHACS